jgi:hypothetical protein
MGADDLNERVQARLVQLESMAGSLQHDLRDPQQQLMWFLPPWGLSMVASWRERQERHGPVSFRGQEGEEGTCCAACGFDLGFPCPDALFILREIGIEP